MDARIVELFSDLIEGRLSAEQAVELNQILQTNATAAAEFDHLLGIHLALSERVAPVRAFSAEELRAIAAVDDRFDRSLVGGKENTIEMLERRSLRRWKTAFVIAVITLITVSIWSLFGVNSGSHRQIDTSIADSGASGFVDGVVAQVRRKIDCDWADNRWTVATSAQIAQGQMITLSKGLLVLEFKSGAEITLNGPATFIATSDMSAQLVNGELSARVPPRARGFRIETHAGDFVDLGTEFGLLVADNGDVETHVFKGQVVAEPATTGGRPADRALLETGEAWLRPVSGLIETGIAAAPDKFMLPLHEDESVTLPPPPVDRALALWFAADSLVQRDAENGVSEWGDITEASNRQRENAWQVTVEKRPKWIGQSIGGRPVLRFDGYKGLVTEPLKLGPSQSSAIVFRLDGDVARELIEDRGEYRELGVQLLNLSGPPNTVVQVNGDLTLAARVHLGWVRDKITPVDVGLVQTSSPLDNNPHVLVYSFDTKNARAQLYLDGRLVSETPDVPPLSATNAPRFIGSHFHREGFGFTGDLAEVLVYDDALMPIECQMISAWLGKKYGITAGGGERAAVPAEERGN
jgi:hypothetical protein